MVKSEVNGGTDNKRVNIRGTRVALLELRGLGKNFGSNVAVSAIDMRIEDGEIRGLIGPNGSGKTTVFNVISGFLKPTRGNVAWQGQDITSLPPHVVTRVGLVRTFQLTALFREMTVLQNVIISCHLHTGTSLWQQFWRSAETRRKEREIAEKAVALLESMGIAERKDEIAGELPHGHQAALGIVNALATEPKMIMLDEPVSGMSPTETSETMERIKTLRDRGITVFLVEHDMRAVMTTCDKITCINFGIKIAEGTAQEVCTHPEVLQAYLGEEMKR
jgi:branched-chain amino acid transport system ATP-binding protein